MEDRVLPQGHNLRRRHLAQQSPIVEEVTETITQNTQLQPQPQITENDANQFLVASNWRVSPDEDE